MEYAFRSVGGFSLPYSFLLGVHAHDVALKLLAPTSRPSREVPEIGSRHRLSRSSLWPPHKY